MWELQTTTKHLPLFFKTHLFSLSHMNSPFHPTGLYSFCFAIPQPQVSANHLSPDSLLLCLLFVPLFCLISNPSFLLSVSQACLFFSASSTTSLSSTHLPCSSLSLFLTSASPSPFFSLSCVHTPLPLTVWWAQKGAWRGLRLKVEGYRGEEDPCCSARGNKCHHDRSCTG